MTINNAALEPANQGSKPSQPLSVKVDGKDITSHVKLYYVVSLTVLLASVLTGFFGNAPVGSVSSDFMIAISQAAALVIVVPAAFLAFLFGFTLLLGKAQQKEAASI